VQPCYFQGIATLGDIGEKGSLHVKPGHNALNQIFGNLGNVARIPQSMQVGGVCIVEEQCDSYVVPQVRGQPFFRPAHCRVTSWRPCGSPHLVCFIPELTAVEEYDLKISATDGLLQVAILVSRKYLQNETTVTTMDRKTCNSWCKNEKAWGYDSPDNRRIWQELDGIMGA